MESLAAVFEKDPILVSRRLLLRKITLRDAEDVYAYARQEATSRYLLWSPHPSLSYTKRYLASLTHQYKKGTFFDFGVTLRETGRMIGTCGFTSVREAHNAGEMGYVIAPDCWGQGYGTEAARLLLSFAFFHLGVHRMEARFMMENTASRRVAERCGMVFEGVCREQMLVKGKYCDIGVCSVLEREFRSGLDGEACQVSFAKERRPSFFTSF